MTQCMGGGVVKRVTMYGGVTTVAPYIQDVQVQCVDRGVVCTDNNEVIPYDQVKNIKQPNRQ